MKSSFAGGSAPGGSRTVCTASGGTRCASSGETSKRKFMVAPFVGIRLVELPSCHGSGRPPNVVDRWSIRSGWRAPLQKVA
jgi:hypothetical protein